MRARFGMLELHAREKIGADDSWTVFKFECLPATNEPTQVYRMVGAVEAKGKGGRPTWPKPHRDVYITPAEHNAWCLAWEVRTGKCRECQGDGVVFAGWNRDSGTRTRRCHRCAGSGQAPSKDVGIAATQGEEVTDALEP